MLDKKQHPLHLNDQEYLEMSGLNVMLGQDFYPDGHQGGVVIIQNGNRVASNGDLRLEVCGGQWQPVPRLVSRSVDRENNSITVNLAYPDPAKNRTGFNPIEYPDLDFGYSVQVRAEGRSFRIRVDLEKALPEKWASRVRFSLELFPGSLFGASFISGSGETGIFPLQPNGPSARDGQGELHLLPLASGDTLTIAGERDLQRIAFTKLRGGPLVLLDGRERHSNGWFIIQSDLQSGTLDGAMEWLVEANALPDFRMPPVVQINQVGYRLEQEKRAYAELDKLTETPLPLEIKRIHPDGSLETVASGGALWGQFLRSKYLVLDFTEVKTDGLYLACYGETRAGPFRIGETVFSRHVWQTTLEYFLPVQMCHMRVEDGYRVWHGDCHASDALMAAPNLHHFDGYAQGPSTLCAFAANGKIEGLNEGGWHDAGDFDTRIESQAGTVHGLSLAREIFGVDYDNTTVDWSERKVILRRSDGTPDILEQIEHGLRALLGSWRALGRLYSGIIEADLQDYVLLGDPVNHRLPRKVFTEENPAHELYAGAALAAASRVMAGYKPALESECREVAGILWKQCGSLEPALRIGLAVELLLCEGTAETGKEYADFLGGNAQIIADEFAKYGWMAVRVLPLMDSLSHSAYRKTLESAAAVYRKTLAEQENETPYGVPYRPHIWGAGWAIQHFGMQQFFLNRALPKTFGTKLLYRAFDFILGCHPGSNNASFVSGVGAHSVTVAYGLNRADHSFIPGGSVSGTALIRPDLPELLEWPYLWQQTEYVLGGGTSDWLFLALAADKLGLTKAFAPLKINYPELPGIK